MITASQGRASVMVVCRALEPVAGVDLMRARRGEAGGTDARLAAGPGRACQAFDIDRGHTGIDLLADDGLWLATDGRVVTDAEVVTGPRIGVDYAGPDWSVRPWRFGLGSSGSLSRPFLVRG